MGTKAYLMTLRFTSNLSFDLSELQLYQNVCFAEIINTSRMILCQMFPLDGCRTDFVAELPPEKGKTVNIPSA